MNTESEEKNVVQEAEVSPVEKSTDLTLTRMRKRRNDLYIELALFLILGILIGVAVKKEAVKKVTMGFEDYKMESFKQDYDLNALQATVVQKAQDAKAAAEAAKTQEQDTPAQDAPEQTVSENAENAPEGN